MELNPDALAAALPDRPVHAYPALLSTEADALARARAGEPAGTLVTADYQVAPRGRGGVPWDLDVSRELAFSLIVRPSLPAHRQGWLYLVACCGLLDTVDPSAVAVWPDEVHEEGHLTGAVTVRTDPDSATLGWGVVTVRLATPDEPVRRLARAVSAIETRLDQEADVVLAAYRPRCQTLGRQVTARLIPVGPTGTTVTGLADGLRDDGALVLATRSGQRIAVPPQNLGRLDEAL